MICRNPETELWLRVQQVLVEKHFRFSTRIQGAVLLVSGCLSLEGSTQSYPFELYCWGSGPHENKVFLRRRNVPLLASNHVHRDGSLCLYHWTDRVIWVRKHPIVLPLSVLDLVSMTANWVRCYERMITENIPWPGLEAPHGIYEMSLYWSILST